MERSLRIEQGNVVLATKGRSKGESSPESNLRDMENVPLNEDVEAYFTDWENLDDP